MSCLREFLPFDIHSIVLCTDWHASLISILYVQSYLRDSLASLQAEAISAIQQHRRCRLSRIRQCLSNPDRDSVRARPLQGRSTWFTFLQRLHNLSANWWLVCFKVQRFGHSYHCRLRGLPWSCHWLVSSAIDKQTSPVQADVTRPQYSNQGRYQGPCSSNEHTSWVRFRSTTDFPDCCRTICGTCSHPQRPTLCPTLTLLRLT